MPYPDSTKPVHAEGKHSQAVQVILAEQGQIDVVFQNAGHLVVGLQGMPRTALENYPFTNLLARRANDKNTPKVPCGPYGS